MFEVTAVLIVDVGLASEIKESGVNFVEYIHKLDVVVIDEDIIVV